MGTLTERIERRKQPVTPIIERREPAKLPEWRRRAQEQQEQLGNPFLAVTDLTERSVA